MKIRYRTHAAALSVTVGLVTLMIATAAWARAGIVLRGDFEQGSLIVGHSLTATQVLLDGQDIPIAGNGYFVFGFGRDAKPESVLEVHYASGRHELRTLHVRQRRYNVQRIDGLPEKKVTPPPAVQKRLKRERYFVARARAPFSKTTHWSEPFIWPAHGRISGYYGSQRVLNGIPKRPHFGVDIAGPVGSPVRAPGGGTVTLAQPDFYYEGGIVIIDHGHSVTSTLFHLNTVEVEVGQQVFQGQKIGTIGKTGRATGAHVDWRINWGKVRIDPQLLVDAMPGR